MRVLHVLHTSVPDTSGYSIRSDYILRCQRGFGVEPAVVTSARHPNGAELEEEIDGVRYLRTPRPRGPLARRAERVPFAREALLMRLLQGRIAQAARAVRPALIHAHSPVLCGLPALRVARRAGLPFVYEVRDFWENASVDKGKFAAGSTRYRLARALETYLLRHADRVTVICNGLARELIARGVAEDRIVLIPNGVDAARFEVILERLTQSGDRTSFAVQPGEQVLAYIGSFARYEGLDCLLRALPLICRSVPGTRLLLVGDGETRGELEELARELQVSDRVCFTGRLPHEEALACYSVADLCVYPRVRTNTTALTTPLKPLEAMAMGKPVLASNVPAMREIVRDGENGILFRAGDVKDLAFRAVRLLLNASLRAALGELGRAFVLRERDWRQVTRPYTQIYESLATCSQELRAKRA